MTQQFNSAKPHTVFPNVECADIFTTKKGGQCAKIQWMGGEQVIFDEEAVKRMNVGGSYDIKANLRGDFLGPFEILEAGSVGGTGASSSQRRTRAAA